MAAGSVWQEPLILRHSGSPEAPIRIRAYGEGPTPIIAPGEAAENAIHLRNVSHIHISGLEVSNNGSGEAVRRGVLIEADNCGVVRDIRITDLFIHDINGTNARKDNGGIVFRTKGHKIPSRFDNLVIERNILHHVDRSGIVGWSDQLSPARWYPSTNVIIRDNYLEDIGGDGIVPWTTLGCLVEHNILRHAVQRAPGYNAGIWQWSTDNTLMQLNDVAFTKGTLDGQGYDSDYNSRGTTLRHNYSRDNDGGFLLICNPGIEDKRYNVGNIGTEVHRNISRGDRARSFHLAGGNAMRIDQNAIYTPADDSVAIIMAFDWDGWTQDAVFQDNLFAARGPAEYGHGFARNMDTGTYQVAPGWGGATGLVFSGNRYQGTQKGKPQDSGQGSMAPIPLSDDRDWVGPTFNPTTTIGFDAFLDAHRTWLIRLMTDQFGSPPNLEGGDALSAPLPPRTLQSASG